MPLPFEYQRYQALLKLATARFGTLNEAEERVLQLSASTDWSAPEAINQRPEVGASFLRWLTTDKDAAEHIDPRGIRVYNATVSDLLDLNFCRILFPLTFTNCNLKLGLLLQYSELSFLNLESCSLDSTMLADGVRVASSLFLRSSRIRGTISLVGAKIEGDMDCSGATVTWSSGTEWLALNASMLKARNLYLRNGFSTKGAVALLGAEIAVDLDCSEADRFGSLICSQMRVGQRMLYSAIVHPEAAELTLSGASVGFFQDDERSWPQKGKLHLNGFVYQQLVAREPSTPDEMKAYELGDYARLDVGKRISWLGLQPDRELDDAQPWIQLAKFLELMGETRGAKHVIYLYSRHRAERSPWRPLTFVYDQIEENPLRIGWFIGGFWAIGTLVFWRAERINAMRSTSNGAAQPVPRNPIPLNPAIYALENVLPVVKLGQDSAWEPAPDAKGRLFPNWWIFASLDSAASRWRFTRWLATLDYPRLAALRWLLILVGWVLALILAAAIGEQFKR